MRFVFILIVLLSFNLQAQKKFSISLSEGFLQFDKFNNYGYSNSETWYYSQAVQSEIELSYNVFTKKNLKLNIGTGFANTHFIDTGFFFPDQKRFNSLFLKTHIVLDLSKSPFYTEGSFNIYYLPPLFRKFYSQKHTFESLEFGFGYKLTKGLSIGLKVTASITSPYYGTKVSYPFSKNINPNLEFTGGSFVVSKTIF